MIFFYFMISYFPQIAYTSINIACQGIVCQIGCSEYEKIEPFPSTALC